MELIYLRIIDIYIYMYICIHMYMYVVCCICDVISNRGLIWGLIGAERYGTERSGVGNKRAVSR